MNRIKKVLHIREKFRSGKVSVGSWMQIPDASVAEIMGQCNYDWIAVDLEHGSISTCQLPDIFRALELGDTLPLARIAEGNASNCKQALDAGAGGIIVPMIESAEQLKLVRDSCCWPPTGQRGVGFSRANLFGKYFDEYLEESQTPLLVAMIENITAVKNLTDILQVKGLDAILIGPYDLSASMGITAQFDNQEFKKVVNKIEKLSQKHKISCGIHIVTPDTEILDNRIKDGYRFIAYSIDSVFLRTSASIEGKLS